MSSTKANGAYPAGHADPVTVTFSENVTVTGTPTIALNSGGTATYNSGSGGSTLTFNYTSAPATTRPTSTTRTSSLALSGGTIKDAATNNATLTLPAVGGASSIGGQKPPPPARYRMLATCSRGRGFGVRFARSAAPCAPSPTSSRRISPC